MASWQEVEALLEACGAHRLSETMWSLQLQGVDPSRRQRVFVSYEVMKPDLEFIKILSPVALMSQVDVTEAVRRFGGLHVGMFSRVPQFENGMEVDGFLNLGTTFPLVTLSFAEPTPLLLYVNVLAQAADQLEGQLANSNVPDMF